MQTVHIVQPSDFALADDKAALICTSLSAPPFFSRSLLCLPSLQVCHLTQWNLFIRPIPSAERGRHPAVFNPELLCVIQTRFETPHRAIKCGKQHAESFVLLDDFAQWKHPEGLGLGVAFHDDKGSASLNQILLWLTKQGEKGPSATVVECR